jgi:hypothetical protein
MKKFFILSILSLTILSCSNNNKYQHSSETSESEIVTSKGYTSDPNYEPTVDDRGEYHTIDGRRKQIQYQGSQEQKRDLDLIDEYMRNNPDF